MTGHPEQPVLLAGNAPDDQRLWQTYVYWARSILDPSTPRRRGLLISQASDRIPRPTSQHLQAVIFAAFMLEYRIKRIYEVLHLAYRKRDTLGVLLNNFKRRVETGRRFNDKRPVRLPPEWTTIEKKLLTLNTLRNNIAHANYKELQRLIPHDPRKSRAVARVSFNAVVDAIRVTNQAVGYENRTAREARRYFSRLKIK